MTTHAPPAARPAARTPLWLLRTLTLLLAAVFALPACTLLVWQDNRSHMTARMEPAPSLRAFRDPEVPTAFVVQLDAAAVQQLRSHAPELPPQLEWLRVRARHEAFAERLAAACQPDTRWPVRLVLFRDAPDVAAFWTLDPTYAVADLGLGTNWRPHYEAAACDVVLLSTPPATLGSPVPAVTLEYATRRDDGTPLLVRIALTPLALALDAVGAALVAVAVVAMIPLAPIAWLVHELGGGK